MKKNAFFPKCTATRCRHLRADPFALLRVAQVALINITSVRAAAYLLCRMSFLASKVEAGLTIGALCNCKSQNLCILGKG